MGQWNRNKPCGQAGLEASCSDKATEDAVAIPMQVPSEYVSALEGLRSGRPDRHFDLAEVTLDGGRLSLARWLSGVTARLELEFDGNTRQPWFRCDRWTSSPI